jgi:glycosyltransferase involved in cell wall biosynthesis
LIKKGIDLPTEGDRGEEDIDAIWVGRCDEWKNPEAFIELAGKFVDRRFVMICPSAEGKNDYHREVVSRAEAFPNLELRGRTANNEVLDLVSRSRIFCITSSQEGDWPNVVLEAASLRTPVLSLAINYDSLIDEFGGGSFCHGSRTRLAAEFEGMIRDPDGRSKMGDGAYEYVKETHNVHEETRKLIGLLNDLN